MAARVPWPLAAAAALLFSAAGVRADAPYSLDFSPGEDGAATSALASGFLIASFGTAPPSACRVCEIPDLDLSLAQAVGSEAHPETFATLSDIALLAMLGVGVFGNLTVQHELNVWAEDLVILAEAVFANGLLNVTVKRLSARPRPAIKLRVRNLDLAREDRYVSFFSGHASTAATIAAAFATIAYLRGYSYREAALAGGIALSLGVGVLRMAAQRHWFTDVLTGWVVGTTLGVFLPVLLHKRQGDEEPTDFVEEPQRLPLVWGAF